MFAMQSILKNNRLLKTALENPVSVRNAVVNVAAVGLSLNPATKMAYLVPRDSEVCLDISYMGLIKIATDTGSILWAKADIVYETDTFVYHGPSEKPSHTADVFSPDRGKMVGVYCIAKTRDGEYLTETMSELEIFDIRKKSMGSDSKYSPWVNFPGEMWKKACLKRASKTWPKTSRDMGRLEDAIQVINEHDGLQEEYLTSGYKTVGTEQVDLMKIEDLSHRCREIIDQEEEEDMPALLFEISESLTGDEGIELANKLQLTKPEGLKKTHVSLYNSYLKIHRDSLKELPPANINDQPVE